MRVLIVEDDQRLGSIIQRTFKEEGYAADWCQDGQEAEWLGFENPYDLIVLDLMIPRKHGLEVLKTFRDGGIKAPILILTAMDTTDDIVKGLDIGADDYITKPFDIEELHARVRALLRRQSQQSSATLNVGPLVINQARREIHRDGKLIPLTLKEYSLLVYLAKNAGSVLSRNELSEHVWDMNYEPSSNIIDVYVGYLRNKVDKGHEHALIKTVRGHGYMLDTDNTEFQAVPQSNQDSVQPC